MSTPPSSPDPADHSSRDLPRPHEAFDLLRNLRASLAHHELVEGRQLSPLLSYLSAWQSLRLARTHADLLHDAEFKAACGFFLSDIYAPHDFSQRDYDGTRIYNFMNRFLPEPTLRPLALALELNVLTQGLDLRLAEVMRTRLGITECFGIWQYEEAYRLCDNYDVRLRQIDLIVEVGKHLDRVRRLPFVGATLHLARGPALRLGWFEMQDFLERGFAAWKSLRQVDVFLGSIERREKAILNRIYGRPGGAPVDNPFLVSDGGAPEIALPVGDWPCESAHSI